MLAPASNKKVAEVKVEQTSGDGGDLAIGRFTRGLRHLLQRSVEGAKHAPLFKGLGQGLFGILGSAEQEGGGGERLGGDGRSQATSFRVWVPTS